MSCCSCCPSSSNRKLDSHDKARHYDDLKSGASGAPTTQSMKRNVMLDNKNKSKNNNNDDDDESDTRAVDWWRTRSQSTNQSGGVESSSALGLVTPDRTSSSTTQPMQLTPEEEYTWASGVSPQHYHFHYEPHASSSPLNGGAGGDRRMATLESIEVDELSAVREELKRREFKEVLPLSGTIPMRAPSLPIDRSRTEDSAMTDESSLQFKLVEHEEEEGLAYHRHRNQSSSRDDDDDDDDDGEYDRGATEEYDQAKEPILQSPAKIERRVSSHDAFDQPSSLYDLRHKQRPMMDAEIAEDYLAAADNSFDIDSNEALDSDDLDADELDQIVLGVRNMMPRDSPRQEEAETNRVEDILTGRKRKTAPTQNATTKQTVGSMGRHHEASPTPGREPISPHRPPTPEEAAAAAAAAASQIRAPSPRLQMRDSTNTSRGGYDDSNMDSLSNVPSNVDSDTRERYLMACRLLKATMIQKDSRLQAEDKEFLRELLSSAEQAQAPSDYDIAAIETASDLLSDTEDEILQPSHEQNRFRVSNIKEAWHKKARELFASRPANTPGLILPEPLSPFRRLSPAAPPTPPRSINMPALKSKRPGPTSSPFVVLGRKPSSPNGVLTPPLMEALRGFFPHSKTEENFWLKYSLNEHGGNLFSLLDSVKNCKHTVIGVETRDGHVFGAFCSSSWKVQQSWFGSGECFLWRLKKSRLAGGGQLPNYDFDNEMEVYPYTGHDEQIQYCTDKTLAVGGGEWSLRNGILDTSPHQDEPMGIAFLLDGDLMGGETNSCATFANPRLCGKESGSNEFDIFGLEVWTLTPCLTVSEARTLEEKRAFVDQHAVVRR